MTSITSNIPSVIFYCSTMSEFVRIAKLTLKLKYSLPVAKTQFDQMINQNSVFQTYVFKTGWKGNIQ